MVERWWGELNRKFPQIRTDAFVVMPNHIHGIIVMESVGADLRVCPDDPRVCPDGKWGAHIGAPLPGGPDGEQGAHTGAPQQAGAPLPEIVQWFKTMTTNEYIRGVKQSGWLAFRGRLWQRNYYEHIIRSE
jgi:hypothetical protein